MSTKKPSNKIIIEALNKTGGNIKASANILKVDRTTLHKWLDKYPILRQARNDSFDSFIDLAESKLMSKVNDGDMTAIIFTLKTQGRNRGYVERTELTIDRNAKIKVGYDDDEAENGD
jgi:hypothetical protein